MKGVFVSVVPETKSGCPSFQTSRFKPTLPTFFARADCKVQALLLPSLGRFGFFLSLALLLRAARFLVNAAGEAKAGASSALALTRKREYQIL